MQRLSMDSKTLDDARDNLIKVGLIAYKAPLYQVLTLDRPKPGRSSDNPMSLGKILKQAGGIS